jgi:uncharacterized protein YceK
VALAALCASGCGTILNLASGDPQIYGGPQADVMFALTPGNWGSETPPASSRDGNPIGEGIAGAFPFLLVLADFPLSLVGDTFTLPLTIYMRQNKHPKPDRAVNGTTPGPEVPAKPFWPEVVNIDAPPAAARQATDTRPSGPP